MSIKASRPCTFRCTPSHTSRLAKARSNPELPSASKTVGDKGPSTPLRRVSYRRQWRAHLVRTLLLDARIAGVDAMGRSRPLVTCSMSRSRRWTGPTYRLNNPRLEQDVARSALQVGPARLTAQQFVCCQLTRTCQQHLLTHEVSGAAANLSTFCADRHRRPSIHVVRHAYACKAARHRAVTPCRSFGQ